MAGRVLDHNAPSRFSDESAQISAYIGIGLLVLAIFAIDVLTPRTFTAAIFLYYFPIFISARLRFLYAPFIVGGLVSISALAGFYLATQDPGPVEITNRLFVIATLWAMTALAYRRSTKNQTLVAKGTTLESGKKLRDMIAASKFGIQIIDRAGNKLFANQALADMMGYESVQALLTVPSLDLVAPHDRGFALECRDQSRTTDDSELPTYELDGLRKDGTTLRLQIVVQQIDWENADARQQTFIDVSDRQRARDALAESEKRYRELCEDLKLGLLIASRRGKLLVNKAYADLLGYDSAEEFMALGRFGGIAPYDLHRAPTMANIDATPPDQIPLSYKIDQVRKDGTIVPVEIFSRVLQWNGERAVQNIIVDLSERKQAEAALAKSEHQFRKLFEDLQLGVLISRAHGKLMVNNAYVDMLGYDSADELMSVKRHGDIAPYHRQHALTLDEIEQADGHLPSPMEIDLLRKDGAIVPTEIYWRVLEWEGEKAVERIFVDLTKRKRAEEALVESEQRYRDLIEGAPIGMQIAAAMENRLLVNKALATMLGYDSADELIGLEARALVAPYHYDRTVEFTDIANPNVQFRETDELDLVCKNGDIRTTQVFRRRLIWQGENAVQLAYIDITERKRAEAALVESEERYRKLFEESPLGIRITDENGNRQANQALARMLGYDSVEELLTLPKKALIAPGHLHRAITYERIRTDRGSVPASVELDIIKKDGSPLPVQVFWRTLEWRGVRAVERTYIDISERRAHEHVLQERDRTVRELRQELSHASQVGTMGEIAAVIAHELHQPLAAIANTASAAQRRLSDEHADKKAVLDEMLPLITSQASRAGSVIGGIRKLFDGKRTERSLQDINSVVAEACELAANEFKADTLEISRHFAERSSCAVVDKVQIQQVIYNLLRNAADALQESATKDVTVSIRHTDDQMIRISVKNAGPSLPDHVRANLFEPFFTTKENGMGMGLYTCQRIVNAHEGEIWAEPDDKSGTTIQFTLPLARQTIDPTDAVH